MKRKAKVLILFLIPVLILQACAQYRPNTDVFTFPESDTEDVLQSVQETEPQKEPLTDPQPQVIQPLTEPDTPQPSSEEETQPDTLQPSSEEETQPDTPPATQTSGGGNIKLKVRQLDPSKPMVALTFDDGPSKYTTRILDKLESVGGRGTFCVVGERLANYTGILERMIKNGHELSSHTWSHTNLKKASKQEGTKAIASVQTYLKDKFDYDMAFFRPPYGAVNDRVKEESRELGLGILYWSVDTLDWSTRDAAKTLQEVKKSTEKGSIILFHDIYEPTADAIDKVVPYLVDQGYQLVTVSELMYYMRGSAETGRIYYNG